MGLDSYALAVIDYDTCLSHNFWDNNFGQYDEEIVGKMRSSDGTIPHNSEQKIGRSKDKSYRICGKCTCPSHDCYYWRKCYTIHSYMERLWIDRDMPGAPFPYINQPFNCIHLRLLESDINDIVNQIKEKSGELWLGSIQIDRHLAKHLIKFTNIALDKILKGFHIYYVGWY